ncbi:MULTISPECIES: FMN-dependent L-lactate dehydrogenase LldD [Caulobacter]|uniref:FMN-dependent L-lactate dehydrogenase LldD n=1 Tax=Caulobacter TaxID=75 RepID=UPI0006FB3DDE|nr:MULTISPECIES: FMN-dependent L-lactate dehydrogenase LldD [Caulobacter]KQZ22861.1 alpha-hydroxy-acid oxidizing enzyme [Caulobacter sp. Root1472]GGL41211.1 L-lactate dehydrogenase [Caulobacter rhizosphaerae]
MIVSSTTDFREAARRKLPRFLFDYIDGGAYAERTLARNVSDLADLSLRQRVLKDVSQVDLSTTLFGHYQALPVALAPVGLTGMYARRGECQAAKAAAAKGVPFCLSTVSVCDLAEVSKASPAPIWFQLYVLRDRAFMRDLLAKAADAGATALVFTVDMPVPGARYRDAHSGMSGPNAAARRLVQAVFKPSWAWDVGVMGRPHTLGNVAPVLGANSGLEDFMGWLGANFDPSIQWKDLDWIRDQWKGPLIIKGVLDPEDAKAAADIGADGIVVSNHGGRQLDGVLSSARALPDIAEAVGDRLTVLADSGVRSGLDVVRMLALGAKGVLLGRAFIYALAARGGPGVSQLLDLIEKEMRVAMALTGVNSLGEIDRSILAKVDR